MRIKEEYRKSGYFWLPENIQKRVPGIVTIFDGGEIELEIMGLFDASIEAHNERNLSRIIGEVEDDGPITLENCSFKQIAFGGLAKSSLRVETAMCGVAYDKDEFVTFNTVSFAVQGINEWVDISGIEVTYGDDFKTVTISYAPQKEIVYNLNNGFKLHIFFRYTLPGTLNKSEAMVTHHAFFKLSSEEAKELPLFIEVLHKFTYLLCFALDATVTISDVLATSNDLMIDILEDQKMPAKIKLYYSSRPFSENEPKIDCRRFLFKFSDIRENAEQVFNNWLDAFSVIKPSLGLYFSAAMGDHKYLDGRFLALAQGLETYHRRTSSETLMERAEFRARVARLLWTCPKEQRKWLRGRLHHGNEISLRQRIKRIIEPYKTYLGNSRQRNKIIGGIVNTRNYLTHYSEELERDAFKGIDLWVLCQNMEAIFQLHLLRQLGFNKVDIEKILGKNYKLQTKFR